MIREPAPSSYSAPTFRRTLFSLFSLLLMSSLIRAAPPQPSFSTSPTEEPQVQLKVKNRTGYPVEVLYLDKEQNQYMQHASLPSGQDMSQLTVAGFTWYFGVNGETVIGEYTVTDEADQAVRLDAQTLAAVGLSPPAAAGAQPDGSLKPRSMAQPVFTSGPDVPVDIPQKPSFDADALSAEAAPVRGPLVPWYEVSGEVFAFFTHDLKYLTADETGVLSTFQAPRGEAATTKSAWILTEVDGKENTYRIQNVYYLDRYLYADANARAGSPVLLGPQGKQIPTGEWHIVKREYSNTLQNAALPHLSIGSSAGKIGLSAKTYDFDDAEKYNDIRAYMAGDTFGYVDAAGYRELMDLVPALVQMGENFAALERQEEAQLAEIEQQKEAAAKAELERRRIARIPRIVGGANRSETLAMRLGVGDLQDGERGEKVIRYTFAPKGPPLFLSTNLPNSENKDGNQFMDLHLTPEVTAWVADEGQLYVGIDTGNESSINLRHGLRPSTEEPTDGNWYIGHVRMNLRFDRGREVIMYPVVNNREISFGFSQDISKGVNFSAEEIMGADISESQGLNTNFQAREYEIIGQRGPGEPFIGSVQYEWDSCGLADKPKSTEPCTYVTPVDMFDPKTLSLRKLPVISQALPGLETRTVFKNYFPVQGLEDRLMMHLDVQVQLHMVKIVRTTSDNTANKGWKDFQAGFTYVWRPDLWDVNASFDEQQVIKESRYKPVGFTLERTFRYWLFIHVEDLKPFMKI